MNLLTTDKDFDHLETSVLSLQKISQAEIKKYFKGRPLRKRKNKR